MYTLLENFKIDAAGAPGNIDEQILSRAAGAALNIPLRKLHGGRILNKSVDARRGRPQLIYTVLLSVDDDLPGIKAVPPEKLASILTPPEPELPGGSKLQSPIVVGTGPAGIFAALALPVVGWVLLSFCLACAADVKVIRNKLYGESNAPIAEYFTAAYKEGENAPLNANDNLGPMLENLKKMKELLDGGVLTKEEFDALKKKYLGDI